MSLQTSPHKPGDANFVVEVVMSLRFVSLRCDFTQMRDLLASSEATSTKSRSATHKSHENPFHSTQNCAAASNTSTQPFPPPKPSAARCRTMPHDVARSPRIDSCALRNDICATRKGFCGGIAQIQENQLKPMKILGGIANTQENL